MLPLAENNYFQITVDAALLLCLTWAVLQLGSRVHQALKRKPALIDRINAELPQTQCGQCGHAGCLPYARAISQGEAINKCPPGGITTIRRLSTLLNELDEALDPAHGELAQATVAFIREDECIGCTKCIQACPVDAIVGAAKLMHTVIKDECTGCDLCVAPCPVDCIDMIAVNSRAGSWIRPAAMDSQRRLPPTEPGTC